MFVVGQAVVDCAVWTEEQEKGTLMSDLVLKVILELIYLTWRCRIRLKSGCGADGTMCMFAQHFC